jgi:hypothetical protein
MTASNDRLLRLVALARDSAPVQREMLIGELAELLADWPQDCPQSMRKAFELLLDKKRREAEAATLDEPALIARARTQKRQDWTVEFAGYIGIDAETAARIVREPTGEALAVACKAARLSRATFSALAVLAAREDSASIDEIYARLANYESVSEEAAREIMAGWRSHAA